MVKQTFRDMREVARKKVSGETIRRNFPRPLPAEPAVR
jgi:hypothetical protein